IDWIEAADYYAVLHAGGKQHLLRVSLRHLEQGLPSDRFVRIHRRTIVRIDRILSVHSDAGGVLAVKLIDGTRLTVSRRLRERLRGQLLPRGGSPNDRSLHENDSSLTDPRVP